MKTTKHSSTASVEAAVCRAVADTLAQHKTTGTGRGRGNGRGGGSARPVSRREVKQAARAAAERQAHRARLVKKAERREQRRENTKTAGRHLAYRYRRQYAPILLLAGLYAAGAVATVLPPLAVPGLAAGICGGALWHLRGHLSRRVEQIYTLTCLTAACVWLAVAAGAGVGGRMPAVLAVAGVGLALPWWRHQHTRPGPRPAETAPTDLDDWWAATAEAFGGAWPESHLTEHTNVPNGQAATLVLPAGKLTTSHVIQAGERIASAREGSVANTLVEPTRDRTANRARLTLLTRSQLDTVRPWSGPTLDLATGMAPAGPYADQGQAYVQFFKPGWGPVHWLISGTTGAGKSRFVDWTLAESAHSGVIATWAGDPQGGQSLPAWRDRVHRFADSPEAITTMLRDARAEMLARSARLARMPWSDEDGHEWTGREGFDPSPGMPVLQVVLEEAQDVLTAGSQAVKLAEGIARMGRKCGLRLVLITHLPTVEYIGGSHALRSLLAGGNVVCFRSAERVSKNLVLPPSFSVDPYAIPMETEDGESTSGTAYIYGPRARPVSMRNYLVCKAHQVAADAPLADLHLVSEHPETGTPTAATGEHRAEDTPARPGPARPEPGNRQEGSGLAASIATILGTRPGGRGENSDGPGGAEAPPGPGEALAPVSPIASPDRLSTPEAILTLDWDGYGHVMDRGQITAELPSGADPSTISRALRTLTNSGTLTRLRKGVYQRPADTDTDNDTDNGPDGPADECP
jgi:hypothetical protein